MPSIFLSHSEKDKPFARKLADSLANQGVNVWIDEANLEIGDSLVQNIAAAINEADYICAILSPNSIGSEWIRRELTWAMTKEINDRRVVILPILIESCELPDFLKDKLYADFRDQNRFDDELGKLLRAMDLEFIQDESIHKDGVAIDWPGEGPRISGYGVVLSVSESNALYSRYLKYYDEFIEIEKKNKPEDFSPERATTAAVLKACDETYNGAPSENEMEAFNSELSRKFELFFKFVMIMWDMANQ